MLSKPGVEIYSHSMKGEETPNANHTTKTAMTATRKEKFMVEKEQLTKENLRKDSARRTVTDRRESLLHYELLNFAKPFGRRESDRRNGNDRRINSAKGSINGFL